MTGTLELADRPAYHLARLMDESTRPATVSQPALGAAVWPRELEATSRSRVRHMLRGHWASAGVVEAVARWFELDVASFYAWPTADVRGFGGPPLIVRPSAWLARNCGGSVLKPKNCVWLAAADVAMLARAVGVDPGEFYARGDA